MAPFNNTLQVSAWVKVIPSSTCAWNRKPKLTPTLLFPYNTKECSSLLWLNIINCSILMLSNVPHVDLTSPINQQSWGDPILHFSLDQFLFWKYWFSHYLKVYVLQGVSLVAELRSRLLRVLSFLLNLQTTPSQRQKIEHAAANIQLPAG